ncbi:MAG: type III-A CRISPR-associated protein Cas10/Csm1 [Candidatus Methanomethylicaceae archaeon]
MKEEYYLTVLGALLHDVGKLGWRAEKNQCRFEHAYYSRKFVENLPTPILDDGTSLDMSKLAQIVQSHHKEPIEVNKEISGPLIIIETADHAAAAMEREEDLYGEPEEPLESIFEGVCICQNREYHGKELFVYRPSTLNTESVFPVGKESLNKNEMRELSSKVWEGLINESKNLPLKVDKFLESLYYLLKKYTFYTLSAGYKTKARVPLFDHLKTTAALASCLYNFCSEKNVSPKELRQEAFALVLGDASGIQNFIFKYDSYEEARKGMAKRVRGRSLQVSLLMDAAAHMIATRAGVPECNILWCTGGQFAVLIPSTCLEVGEKVSKEVNAELWKKFSGALYLSIGSCKCNLITKKDFTEALLKCEEEIERRKQRKFIEVLEDGFSFVDSKTPRSRCASCGADIQSGEDRTCQVCRDQEELGQTLLKSDYLFRIGEYLPGSHFSIGSFSYLLLKKDKIEAIRALGGSLYSINNAELNPKISDDIARCFMFLGSAAPSIEGNILSFDSLGEMSGGAAKLGLAKGDVDNMGYIMHNGLEGVRIWSYSHMSTLLEVFFAGRLNRLVEKYYTYKVCDDCRNGLEAVSKQFPGGIFNKSDSGEYFLGWWIFHEKLGDPRMGGEIEARLCPKCKGRKTTVIYINYSGGDDFMITGPWDAVLWACSEIREEFGKMTCKNPDMGMSIGYIVADPKHPISDAVSELTSRLSRAKKYRFQINASSFRKDTACIFGDCVPLSKEFALGYGSKSLADLLELAERLEMGVRVKEVPRGFVHDLINYWYDSFLGKDVSETNPRDIEKRRREARSYLPKLRYKIVRNLKNFNKYERDIIEYMPWILIPASWVSLRTRLRRE